MIAQRARLQLGGAHNTWRLHSIPTRRQAGSLVCHAALRGTSCHPPQRGAAVLLSFQQVLVAAASACSPAHAFAAFYRAHHSPPLPYCCSLCASLLLLPMPLPWLNSLLLFPSVYGVESAGVFMHIIQSDPSCGSCLLEQTAAAAVVAAVVVVVVE